MAVRVSSDLVAGVAWEPHAARPIIDWMSRRFQFSLGALFWFVLVVAANIVTWQAFWRNVVLSPRRDSVTIPAYVSVTMQHKLPQC
jgi:hypothetical protein